MGLAEGEGVGFGDAPGAVQAANMLTSTNAAAANMRDDRFMALTTHPDTPWFPTLYSRSSR